MFKSLKYEDFIAILSCILTCWKANSFTRHLLNNLLSEIGMFEQFLWSMRIGQYLSQNMSIKVVFLFQSFLVLTVFIIFKGSVEEVKATFH